MTAELRADLATVVVDAMRRDGWIVPPSTALVVADALIARPGLLRDVVEAGGVGFAGWDGAA